ncbi:hypothetical protein A7M51_17490 [Acinetobacter baumannii]|nr:hypothetical protein A7M51_17490 [Acinetobacter baumannii]
MKQLDQLLVLADDLVERTGVLEAEHDADADDVADGAARQRVGEREPCGVAGLQAGVARLQLQPRRRLPVRRRRQPEPPREQHQRRRRHHDLVGG